MITSKVLGKIEKLCGGDALEKRWYEKTLYKYDFDKGGSKNKTVKGHSWDWNNEGEAVVYRLTDGGWARATVYPLTDSDIAMKAVLPSSSGIETVCSVKGVEDVSEEVLGRTEWSITVDVASGLITDVERNDILDGNAESSRMKEHRDTYCK